MALYEKVATVTTCLCVCVCAYLELLADAPRVQVLPYLMQHGQHGDVGLPSPSRSTDQQVLIGVVGRLKHNGLDPVQTSHAFEHQLGDLLTHTHTHTEVSFSILVGPIHFHSKLCSL